MTDATPLAGTPIRSFRREHPSIVANTTEKGREANDRVEFITMTEKAGSSKRGGRDT